MKQSTIDKLKEAFQAGMDREQYLERGYNSGFAPEFDEWLQEYLKPKKEVEETVPITYGMIKNSCGWSKFCDITGGNHYAVKEYVIDDREIFDVTISHAKQLGLI